MPSGYVINDLVMRNVTFRNIDDGEIIWTFEINDPYIPPVDVELEFENKNNELDTFLREFTNKEVVA